jgi:hypothetical protein
VKTANIDANSSPRREPLNSRTKNTTVNVRNPRIGTDWRMSSRGMSTFSARRSRAAAVANTKVKIVDRARAASMRNRDWAA